MTIAGCWIIKDDDELDDLKASVASIESELDSIHITANGRDVSEIEKWCKENKYDYSYLKWNFSFSEQRNFNFSRVPKGTDYIWWMDTDDILIGKDKLREVAAISHKDNLDAVYFTYWYSSLFDGKPSLKNLVEVNLKHEKERLIRPGKMVWKKRCHENPVELPGVDFKFSSYQYDKKLRPMAVMHTAAHRLEDLEVQWARNTRNRELMELDLIDEMKETGHHDPRTLLYLMKVYVEIGDDHYQKCLDFGEEYLSMSGWDLERNTCLMLMGRCYEETGEKYKALELYYLALKEYPTSVNTQLKIANAYIDLGKYEEANMWLTNVAMLEEKKTVAPDNILENKVLASRAGARLFYEWEGHKDFVKAHKFAETLVELEPTEQNIQSMEVIAKTGALNDACRNTDHLLQYIESTNDEKAVLDILESLPQAIISQPFAHKYLQKHSKPRYWDSNEICYYANFSGGHFEKWDGNSLKKGIGGSETAVIRLAEEWTKLGYSVIVYGDPEIPIEVNGVLYLPYYYFNRRDKFNIFISWRSSHMAKQVSAKRFYVDLHDIFSEKDIIPNLDQIDALLVKSEYHRSLAPNIPDNKFKVVSNGIS